MVKKMLLMSALSGTLSLFAGFAGVALAVGQERAQDRVQTQEQKQIYGSELMTQQERAEFRTKMQTAKSAEEREQIRMEHHERMKERARTRGITLPDEPPSRGGGMGPGGGGKGPGGGGMGPGGGRGR